MKLKNIFSLSLLLFLTFATQVFAQKKVAVIPFDVLANDPKLQQLGLGTMDKITTGLSNVQDFIIVDRTLLNVVMKEPEFQHIYLADIQTLIKLGKLLNSEILILGSIQTEKDIYRVNVHFMEVDSGETIKILEPITGTSIFDIQDKITNEIIKQKDLLISKKQEINNTTTIEGNKKVEIIDNSKILSDYYIKGKNYYYLFTPDNYEKAIEIFDKMIELDNNNSLAIASKAEAQAQLAYEIKLEKLKNNSFQKSLISSIMSGEINSSENLVKKTEELAPYYELLSKASDNANLSLKLNNSLAEGHRALSLVHSIENKFEDGLYEAEMSLKINPNDSESYLVYALNTENNDKKIELLNKAIELNPSIIHSIHELSKIYIEAKKYDLAIENLNKIIKINPNYQKAYIILSDVYNNIGINYGKQSSYNLAIENFKKSLDINPNNNPAYGAIGIIYTAQKKYELAIENFKKAIKIAPNNYHIYDNIGNIYFNQEKYELAIENYKKSLNIQPNNKITISNLSNCYNNLGSYYNNQNNHELAIENFKKSLEINSKNSYAHNNLSYIYNILGIYYAKQNNYKIAIDYYKKSIKEDSNNTFPYSNIADIYYNQKNYVEAIKNYKKAMNLDSKNETNALKMYKQMKKTFPALYKY